MLTTSKKVDRPGQDPGRIHHNTADHLGTAHHGAGIEVGGQTWGDIPYPKITARLAQQANAFFHRMRCADKLRHDIGALPASSREYHLPSLFLAYLSDIDG